MRAAVPCAPGRKMTHSDSALPGVFPIGPLLALAGRTLRFS